MKRLRFPPAMIRVLYVTVAFGAVAACSSASGVSGGGAPGASATAPDWVRSGSGVRGGRVYGLGSSTGIRNTSLARTTASNRARAEISRILEVYSASLMKDYQASTGDLDASSEEQRVEQVIKTYSAQLQTGIEITDYWNDVAQQTWYAQAVLDFEKASQVAEASAMLSSTMKSWVEQNADDVFRSLESELEARAPAPPPAAEAPETSGGAQPAWTEGACDRSRYVCGVGRGPDRTTADAEARAELARIFVANVQAVQESFESANVEASSKTGDEWVEVQEVSSYSMVSSDKVVRMSEIHERWVDASGTIFALALIDRDHASTVLTEEIEALDRKILAAVQEADGALVPIQKLRALRRAMTASAERSAKNGDLRVVARSGIPPVVPLEDIVSRLDQLSAQLRFGLAVEGPGADRVQACLEEALTDRGYAIEVVSSARQGAEFDVRVEGKVRADSEGKIAGDEVVRIALELRLVDVRKDQVIETVRGSEKSTRPTFERAVRTGAYRLCKRQVPKMMGPIDDYFGR